MPSQTKNIITKRDIAQELLQKNKKSLQQAIIFSVVWIALVAVVFWLIYSFGMKSSGTVGYVIYFVSLAVCLFPPCLASVAIPAAISEQKSLLRGEFFVVTDTVVGKEIKSVVKHAQVYEEKTLRFSLYGDVRVDTTCYQLASEGDVFYLVLKRLDSQLPQKYYPANMYEYRE